jgi:hypothetical protein
MKRFMQTAAALLLPAAAAAQTADAPPVLTEAQEIALARSAAPANVSSDATILILRDDKYVTAHEGSNGVTCMVSRSLPLAIEPICYDPEASRTILQMEKQIVELRLVGVPAEEVERRIAESIGRGTLTVPQRPAMAYMLSAGQILYADAETKVGSFYPHLHIYMPYVTAAQLGGLGGGPTTAPGVVFDEGKPTANLVVFAREFVEPEGVHGSVSR